MKHSLVFLIAPILGVPSACAADTKQIHPAKPEASRSSKDAHLRVDELPKPVLELLAEIQRLSAEIEPEIIKFGSRLRAEVDRAVKRLHEAAKVREPETRRELR